MSEDLIIRHGRSNHNIGKSTSFNSTLTPFGVKQAENVGKFLQKRFDLSKFTWFSSPFVRCLQTTDIIRNATKNNNLAKVIVHDGIAEYFDRPEDEVLVKLEKEQYPDFDWSKFEGIATKHFKHFSVNDLIMRSYEFLIDTENLEFKIIITHAMPALALLGCIKREPSSNLFYDYSIDNCSMSYFQDDKCIWHGRNLYHELDDVSIKGSVDGPDKKIGD